MRALHAYVHGDPSRLVVEDAPVPALAPGDVLVRVHASGVSPAELDWRLTWLHHDGNPRTPPIVPGHELSGVVEAIAPGDTAGVDVGDAVFGLIDYRRDGADAELVAVRADELLPKPATLSHAQAAVVPLSAQTAWQALFEHGDLERGQRILIHGGAGGVGSFAVQFARWRGAHVTATSSGRDADLVRGARRRRGDRLPDATIRGRRRGPGSRVRHGRRRDMGAVVGRAAPRRPTRVHRRAASSGARTRRRPASHLVRGRDRS